MTITARARSHDMATIGRPAVVGEKTSLLGSSLALDANGRDNEKPDRRCGKVRAWKAVVVITALALGEYFFNVVASRVRFVFAVRFCVDGGGLDPRPIFDVACSPPSSSPCFAPPLPPSRTRHRPCPRHERGSCRKTHFFFFFFTFKSWRFQKLAFPVSL